MSYTLQTTTGIIICDICKVPEGVARVLAVPRICSWSVSAFPCVNHYLLYEALLQCYTFIFPLLLLKSSASHMVESSTTLYFGGMLQCVVHFSVHVEVDVTFGASCAVWQNGVLPAKILYSFCFSYFSYLLLCTDNHTLGGVRGGWLDWKYKETCDLFTRVVGAWMYMTTWICEVCVPVKCSHKVCTKRIYLKLSWSLTIWFSILMGHYIVAWLCLYKMQQLNAERKKLAVA